MDENADGGTVIAVTTENADTITVDDDRFEVADGNLKLKAGTSLDFETDTSPITVTITATAAGGDATASVDVSINDVNEAPSISVADGAVDENDAGAVVGAVSATDPDAGDTHTYTVSDDRFEVAGGNLKLKDDMSLDHEAAGSVTVTVTVTDAGGLTSSADVTVTVNNVNEGPSAPELRGLPQSVDENDEGAIVASLETGSDPEGDTVSFSVDDNRFEVIAGGVLKLKDGETLDYEGDGGSVDIVVTAMDPQGAMSEPTIVTVEIEDENEMPSIMASDDDVDENDAGAVLSAITLSDPDAGDTHTVRISDFRFTTITDDSGGMWIALKEGESLDHEDEMSVPLTLTVTDAGGLSGTVDVTITVNNVNEAPSVSVGQGVTPGGVIAAPTVDENNAGAPLGEIMVSDPDADDSYTLSVNDPRFETSQDANGGWWVKLRDDQSIDYETETSVALTVTVTDAGGLTGTADVMITVRNVDEAPSAPVVRDGGLNVDENDEGAVVTSLADSSDPEGDDITYSVDDDRFEITGGLVLKLKDGMTLDHEEGDSVTLMLTASDPAGNMSAATEVTVAVNDVNESPSIMAADGAVDENAAGAMVGAVSATDPDDGDSHTFSTDNADFEVAGGMLKLVDGASLNYEDGDSVTVMVTVTDADGLSDTAEVTVMVNDVNEDPSIDVRDGEVVPVAGATSSLTVAENAMGSALAPLALIEVMDPDAADAGMLTGRDGMMATSVDDDRFEVKLDPEGGMWLALKADESLDHEAEDGSVDVMVTFTDSAGNTASATATVTITDLNEAPMVEVQDGTTPDGMAASSVVDENVEGAILGEIVITDQDDGDMVTPSVTDPRFAVLQDSVGGWWLKLADGVSLNFEDGASVDVTVTVTDSAGLTGETVATIMVSNIDEAPSAPAPRSATLAVDENDAGADVSVLDSTDPQGDAITFSVNDDRFEVSDQGVLKLKDGVSLDHESVSSVDLELTAMDDQGYTSSVTMVTVAVNDLNEAPNAVGMVADITPESGTAVDMEVDLMALFSDPDDGDSVGGWRLSGGPSWLELVVVYGQDDDGNATVTGYLRGTPPTTGAESDAVNMATITAHDNDGLTASTNFYVIVDDGNDVVERVNLHNPDGSVNINHVVDVDENDDSGKVFGMITVDDQDHPNHPHGQHMVTVNNPKFEIREDDDGNLFLALKPGESLDHEAEDGYVTVRVTAVDMNGEKDARGNNLGLTGHSELITVNINDVNEAPVAGPIGNWWVTVNNALLESAVTKGSWLEFGLDTEAPGAAFTDPEGDTLEYSLSGPAWLEIDEDDGTITNKAGMTPSRGSYRVTVTATDEDGLSASSTFTLYVAESAISNGDANVSNRLPTISLTTGSSEYTEGSGDRRVATIRAEDDDQDLAGHPFAITSVQIVSVVNLSDAADTNNVTDATAAGAMNTGYAAAFRLTDPVVSGNTLTYGLEVKDTNPGAAVDTTDVLDYEEVQNIRLVVRVTDGNGATSDVTVDVRINDANEAPATVAANVPTAANLTVTQSATDETVLYINLHSMWDDEDIGDPDGTLTFGATSSASWVSILHGPDRWDTISRGPDGIAGNADDVAWGAGGAITVGSDPSTSSSDYVVVVEIDRTGRNNDQDAMGSFTITATDNGGATGTYTGRITVTDQNLTIGANAVSLSGGANPREGGRLTPRFNEARDPDLAGSDSAALVVYTWETHADADDNGEPDTAPGAGTTIMVTTSNAPLTLTQAHVGQFISVSVGYYEEFNGEFTASQAGGSAVTSKVVADSQDRGSAHFNILTGVGDGSNGETLRAEVMISDDDGLPAVPTTVTDTYQDVDGDGTADYVTFTWEVSDNGRGGWSTADSDDDTFDLTLSLANGGGKYYRLVATYTDDAGGSERHVSDPVQIGDLPATERTAPTVTGSANPGGSLTVNATGSPAVQWQKMMDGNWVDIPGATGSLGLTNSDAGSQVRALVTYSSPNSPGATAIVATATQTIGGTVANAAPVTVQANYEIEASVDMGHGAVTGPTVNVEETVNLRSLFQDPDSPMLAFSVTSALGSDEATGDADTLQITSAGGVLMFEERSGKLTYVSDVRQNHDGTATDGDGNIIVLTVTADDDNGGANADATANINLRINVAPTTITTTDATTTFTENVRATADTLVATLDVQDENEVDHKFGTHTITVDDDRFVIKHTGGGPQDTDSDGSTWGLYLKRGSTFDFETDDDDASSPTTTEVWVTLTATDGGGLSTPSGPGTTPIRVVVTITNDTDDDPPAPGIPDVPGLVDDETTDGSDDEREDDDQSGSEDDDNDGGHIPPPPGMSLGIIEDFVDNMDAFEQDLFEDFMLVIDDIDAA